MTTEEKLQQRLKAQGWDRAAVRIRSVTCVVERANGYTEHFYRRRSPLTAEKAMEIENWFKEQLKNE